MVSKDIAQVREALEMVVLFYNNERSYLSLGMRTTVETAV